MRDLGIAYGASRQALKWSNKTITFDNLKERLKHTLRTPESAEEYAKMSKADRDQAKDHGGFVAGVLIGGRRKVDTVESRSMISLDGDRIDVAFLDGFEEHMPYAAALYTTHSSTEEKPRVRIIIPMTRDATPEEFAAVSRYLAQMLGIDYFDECSYLPNQLMAEHLGTTAKYMGMPSCGYQVGDYVVDRDGNIHGEDFGALRDFLQTLGCFPEEETEPAGEQTEPEPETAGDVDQVSISVPADDLTPVQLKNLIFTLYTKQYLIGKMTGGDLLSIPDTLIARLMEKTPDSMEDFKALLDAAREDGMTGFDFGDGKITITYRAHQDEPERNMLYAMLTARILKAAKEATRVFPERQEPENEKYFARAWLLRIGYSGADSKAERTLLLKHILDVNVVGTGAVLRGAVICFYLSNEGLSLLENAAYLGLPIPEKLKEILAQLHDRSKKEGEDDAGSE